MSAPIYAAEKAERLIREKKATGEYHVTGSLYLRGCDLSGVTLPASVGGWLDLSGCDLSGVTLPASVTGSLYLRGCDLSGVTLPASVGGWLDLSGCDLSGVTLPASVTGSLYLRGAQNPNPSQWWSERGEATKRRCIAISNYALIELENGKFIAGCRGPWTKAQCLRHWGQRADARAKAFVAALNALGGEA